MAAAMNFIQQQQKKYPTLQQKNGFQQQLLREKSQVCLLNLFHKKFSRNPATLYQELSQQIHKTKLDKLKRKGVLKDDQYNLIFPASQQTDSGRFDITLLFPLIRTLCGYAAPSSGWDNEPNATDIDDIANALRLKIERNRMQHGQLSISTVEYRRSFNYLKKPLIALGCPQNELNNLLPSFEYGIPPENVNFIGRDNELKEIDQFFNTNKASNVVITGIPGVGKSETANKYYVIKRNNYDHVIRINVDNIENEFKNIATILKFDEKTNIQVIVTLLKKYFQNEKVLFIYDNCIAIEQLTKYLDPGQHNLITTQIQHWGAGYQVVKIEKWPEQTAIQFLQNQLPTAGQNEMSELSKELEYHPLGLQHAVASMTQTQISIKEYLADLRSHKMDVLSERIALGYGIRSSVFASFFITIERIERESPAVMKLLSLLGILDGSFINEEFLQRCYEGKPKYNRAKRILLDYSVIKVNERISEFSNKKINYLTVHSLYQEAVKIYITQNKTMQRTLEQFVVMISSEKVAFIRNVFLAHKLWLSHLRHLWKQNCYKKSIVKQLSVYPAVKILFSDKTFLMLADISKQVFASTKDDLKNPVSYYIEYTKITNFNLGNLKDLENRVHQNLQESRAKTELLNSISALKGGLTPGSDTVMRKMALSLENGHFKELSSISQKLDFTIVLSISYKEMKEFNKALALLYIIPEYNEFNFSSVVQIGCCLILNEEIEKGMKVIQEAEPFNQASLCDVGRACFDVGLHEKSTEYFKRWLETSPVPKNHFELDAFCKILMSPGQWSMSCLHSTIVYPGNPWSHCKIRTLLLICCHHISEDQISVAPKIFETLISEEIEHERYTSNIFREAFILAQHWQKRCRFYKALVVYRMIKNFGDKLYNHEEICEELDKDVLNVQPQIAFCIEMLRKIFHF